MTFEKTLVLGAIAGFTIFLGLPLARMRGAGARFRLASSLLATGILAFLFMEIAGKAGEQVEESLMAAHEGSAGWGRFVGLAVMLAVGFVAGLVSMGGFVCTWVGREEHPARDPAARNLRARVRIHDRLLQRAGDRLRWVLTGALRRGRPGAPAYTRPGAGGAADEP